MDGNITTHESIGTDDLPLSAHLPGEAPIRAPDFRAGGPEALRDAEDAAADAPERAPTSGPARSSRRGGLMLGTAVLLVGAAASGAFLVSPNNHLIAVPWMNSAVRQAAQSAGITLPPSILAPSVSLASVHLPEERQAIRQPVAIVSRSQEVRDLVMLHPDARDPVRLRSVMASADPAVASEAPSAAASAPAALKVVAPTAAIPEDLPGPHEPGTEPTPPAQSRFAFAISPDPAEATAPDAVQGNQATRLPGMRAVAPTLPRWRPVTQAQAPASPAVPAPATPTAGASPAPGTSNGSVDATTDDPVAKALALTAAPMTPRDQVQVLGLVTNLATLIRDLRRREVQFRKDVTHSSADTAQRLADFERRLTLSEARSALAGAADPGDQPSPAVLPAVQERVAAKPAPVVLTSTNMVLPFQPGVTAPTGLRHYRVQAASPGLAFLAEVDRSGDDSAQLQVAVGDKIPDWGRVTAISQRGTTWVVATEHGDID